MEYIRKDKTKQSISITEHIICIPYETYDNGACQCYKNCDCARDKGIKEKFNLYKHNKSKQLFSDLDKCKRDLQLCIDNEIKLNLHKQQASEWFNSMSIKEQNKMINLYKSKYTNLKKQNHNSIRNNPNLILQMHRGLIKLELIKTQTK